MYWRLDKNPQAMRQRRETVEHPFGTLKIRARPERLWVFLAGRVSDSADGVLRCPG
jgi:hypothetical protein